MLFDVAKCIFFYESSIARQMNSNVNNCYAKLFDVPLVCTLVTNGILIGEKIFVRKPKALASIG